MAGAKQTAQVCARSWFCRVVDFPEICVFEWFWLGVFFREFSFLAFFFPLLPFDILSTPPLLGSRATACNKVSELPPIHARTF